MTVEAMEPEVDRGQLIYAMAIIDRQCEQIDKILSLDRMKNMVTVSKALRVMRSELRATMHTVHNAMKPPRKR